MNEDASFFYFFCEGGRPMEPVTSHAILKRRYQLNGAKQRKTVFTKIHNFFYSTILRKNVFFNFSLFNVKRKWRNEIVLN